jgi:hypothetical protein
MTYSLRLSSAWLAGLLAASGCFTPQIQVVDERTALENQILGQYERLDDDLQLWASVRSPAAASSGLHQLRRQALQARRVEIFFQDDVEEFKHLGCLGEGRDALLVRRSCPVDEERGRAAWLERTLEEVNRARLAIFAYVLAASPQLGAGDEGQLRRVFVELRRRQAAAGDWLQQDDGGWVQK